MALINCPECGGNVSDQAPTCPHCGYNLIKMDGVLKDESKVHTGRESKQPINKTMIIVSACVVAAVVITVIGTLIINSPLRKTRNAYRNRNIDVYRELVSKLDDKEKDELSKEIESDIDALYKAYIDGTKTGPDARNDIDDIKRYEINKGYAINKKNRIAYFMKLNEAYQEAQEYIKKEEYVSAYEALSSIQDEEYKDYAVVQDKKKEITENANREATKELKSLVDKDNLKEANDYATDILETDLSDETLKQMCEDAVSKYKKVRKAEEAEKKAAEEAEKQLVDGKVIKTSALEATFVSAGFTNSILPSSTYGYYTYFKPENPGNVYYAMKFSIKNASNYSFDMNDVFEVNNSEFGSSTYSYSCFYNYQGSTQMENIYSWDSINPGESLLMYLAFEVPADKQSESVNISMKLNGKELELKR